MNLSQEEKDLLIKGATMVQPGVEIQGGILIEFQFIHCWWCNATMDIDNKDFAYLSDSSLANKLEHKDGCDLEKYNALIKRLTE